MSTISRIEIGDTIKLDGKDQQLATIFYKPKKFLFWTWTKPPMKIYRRVHYFPYLKEYNYGTWWPINGSLLDIPSDEKIAGILLLQSAEENKA